MRVHLVGVSRHRHGRARGALPRGGARGQRVGRRASTRPSGRAPRARRPLPARATTPRTSSRARTSSSSATPSGATTPRRRRAEALGLPRTSMSARAPRALPREAPAARRRRHARQDDDERDVRVAPVARGPRAGLVHRRRAQGACRRARPSARRASRPRVGGRAPFVVEGDEYDAVYWHKQPKFFDYIGVGAGRRRHRHERRARSHRHLPGRRVVRGGVPRASSARVPARAASSCATRTTPRARAIVRERRARAGRLVRARGRRHGRRDADVARRARGAVDAGRRSRSISSRAASRAGASRCACPGVTTCATRSRRSPRAPRASASASTDAARAPRGVRRRAAPAGAARRAAAACASTTTSRTTRPPSTRRCARCARATRTARSGPCSSRAARRRAARSTRRPTRAPSTRPTTCSSRRSAGPDVPGARARSTSSASRATSAPKARARCPSVDAIVERLAQARAPGDTVALLSNGAFGGIHAKLLERARTQSRRRSRRGAVTLTTLDAKRRARCASRSTRRARPAALVLAGWRKHPVAEHKGRDRSRHALRPRQRDAPARAARRRRRRSRSSARRKAGSGAPRRRGADLVRRPARRHDELRPRPPVLVRLGRPLRRATRRCSARSWRRRSASSGPASSGERRDAQRRALRA